MIIHCKNTLGDGTVIYVDYEVENPDPGDEDIGNDEAFDIIFGGME